MDVGEPQVAVSFAFMVLAHNAERYIKQISEIPYRKYLLTSGSKDMTEQLCLDYGLTYTSGDDCTQVEGLNELLDWATSMDIDYITLLGKDDMPEDGFGSALGNEDVVVVGNVYDSPKERKGTTPLYYKGVTRHDGEFYDLEPWMFRMAVEKGNCLGTYSCWVLPRDIYQNYRFRDGVFAHRLELDYMGQILSGGHKVKLYNKLLMTLGMPEDSCTMSGFTSKEEFNAGTEALVKEYEHIWLN